MRIVLTILAFVFVLLLIALRFGEEQGRLQMRRNAEPIDLEVAIAEHKAQIPSPEYAAAEADYYRRIHPSTQPTATTKPTISR